MPSASCARDRCILCAALGDRVGIQGNQTGNAEEYDDVTQQIARTGTPGSVGMLIAYNLLRHEIAQMADELQVPPQRLSFQWLALAITTALYHWPLQTPGTFPKRLALLRQRARAYLSPER
jgi:hypothetical protein